MSQVRTYGTEEGVVLVSSDGIRCRAWVGGNEGRYLDGVLQEMLVRLIMAVMGLTLTNIVTVIILSIHVSYTPTHLSVPSKIATMIKTPKLHR